MMRFLCMIGLTLMLHAGLRDKVTIVDSEVASQVIGGDEIPLCTRTISQRQCDGSNSPEGGCYPNYTLNTCEGDCSLHWICDGQNDVDKCVTSAGLVFDLLNCDEDSSAQCGTKVYGAGFCNNVWYVDPETGQITYLAGCVCPDQVPSIEACDVPVAGTTNADCVPHGVGFQLRNGKFRIFATLKTL